MTKLMIVLLGLTLRRGVATVSFAQNAPKKEEKKKKAKKSKKKADTKDETK